MPSKEYTTTELKSLLGILSIIIIWSAINDHAVKWLVQSMWVLVGVPILLLSFSRFKFTPLTYRLIFIHACILLVGAHYTYQLTPPGLWVKDFFELERNHFDRLGHLAQGFVPAMIVREILIRRSPLIAGKWLFFIVLCVCMAISVWYEFLEWIAALAGPQHITVEAQKLLSLAQQAPNAIEAAKINGQAQQLIAEATKAKYLAQQGDVWDTQWDMFMAMVGSLSSQFLFARVQDRQLTRYALHPKSNLQQAG
ncbi:Inner membrane protein YjdF [hydrothermal vent metagenome]|uniref:Inner membrane protein YjdF n=1 Tax=hydrothermal vent metagenome TaxID=652676 RepID=A0A3B0Y921_9ZZZZ